MDTKAEKHHKSLDINSVAYEFFSSIFIASTEKKNVPVTKFLKLVHKSICRANPVMTTNKIDFRASSSSFCHILVYVRDGGVQVIPCRTIRGGQFGIGQFGADSSLQTNCRGQFSANYRV